MGSDVAPVGKSIGCFPGRLEEGSASANETLDLNRFMGVTVFDLFRWAVEDKVSSSTVDRSTAFSLRIDAISRRVVSISFISCWIV